MSQTKVCVYAEGWARKFVGWEGGEDKKRDGDTLVYFQKKVENLPYGRKTLKLRLMQKK